MHVLVVLYGHNPRVLLSYPGRARLPSSHIWGHMPLTCGQARRHVQYLYAGESCIPWRTVAYARLWCEPLHLKVLTSHHTPQSNNGVP
jgi:hypothetical protein